MGDGGVRTELSRRGFLRKAVGAVGAVAAGTFLGLGGAKGQEGTDVVETNEAVNTSSNRQAQSVAKPAEPEAKLAEHIAERAPGRSAADDHASWGIVMDKPDKDSPDSKVKVESKAVEKPVQALITDIDDGGKLMTEEMIRGLPEGDPMKEGLLRQIASKKN